MIAYSPDAEVARAYLLRGYNDIDIFVEDSTCQNMYVRLFNRILAARAKVSQVFPLHGKRNLIDKCRADQGPRQRPRLYIMDGDQDLILGRRAPRLRHLYRLRVYCSENLLLSEHAVVTLATECAINEMWMDMAVAVAFRPLLERAVRLLFPLFIEYAVAERLRLGITTVGYSIHRLLANPVDPESLSEQLVQLRAADVVQEILARVTARKYRAAKGGIMRRLATTKKDRSVYISGKAYLLPLVYLQLKRTAGLSDSLDRVKVRLAQHCELSIDPGLKAAVRRALK